MNIQIKYLLVIILVAAGLGAALTRYFLPREVTKTQTIEHEVVKNNIVTVTKEVKHTDGTTEVTTTTTDNSVTSGTTKSKSSENKPVPDLRPNWFVTAGAGLDFTSVQNAVNPVYQLGVNRRILGPVYVGAWANTHSQIGVQLGLEF